MSSDAFFEMKHALYKVIVGRGAGETYSCRNTENPLRVILAPDRSADLPTIRQMLKIRQTL